MAPTEFSSLPISSGPRSVAAFFGDDGDSQPLWFKKEAFLAPTFDSEAYIAGLRRYVPFDTLRSELKSHLAVLKNELVELINRDYADFVNLSTKLVDVDGAVLRMRMPFNELKVKLLAVREKVDESLAALQDGLKRRAEASSSREILELLLDTSHVVSKVEKLLLELQNTPEDGPRVSDSEEVSNGNEVAGELGFSDRSRLLERIASEMNRLKFYVARAQDLPFIQNMEKRIHAADVSLEASLRGCFVGGLERLDRDIVYHCLRAYAALDNTSGAEAAYRSAVVAPAVQKIISPDPLKNVVGGAGDLLEEGFEELKKVIETDCKFLLDLAAVANSGLHMFDFLSNSILREVHSAIQKGRPGAFSPGKPVEFLKNYRSTLQFLDFLEGQYSSQEAVAEFRSKDAYRDFMKQWNVNVYFTLRLQEIAGTLEKALTSTFAASLFGAQAPYENGDVSLRLQPSIALWESLQRCLHNDVYMPSLADKFLRVALQLVSRYSTWLANGLAARNSAAGDTTGGQWASGAAPDDFVLVRNDVEGLVRLIKGPYVDHILELLSSSPDEVLTVVRMSIFQGAETLSDLVPALTDVLTDALAEQCMEALKQLKGITATYRMTNKPAPVRHSPYVASLFQPLKAFMDGESAKLLKSGTRDEVLYSVAEKTTARYDEVVKEVITTAKKTEESLRRLRDKAKQQQRGVGTETSDSNVSDTEKMCAQLFLDVQEYGKRLREMKVSVEHLPTFVSLWESAAPADRKFDIGF